MSVLTREMAEAMLQEFAATWNGGDILGVCGTYADDASYVGKEGYVHGGKGILARYIDAYPDAQSMGHLTLELVEFRPSRPNNGLAQEQATMAVMIVRYILRQVDGTERSGNATMFCERRNDKVLIVHATVP